jgi:serine phosphatase RsbU (regulator of sigma subunit)
MKRFFICYVCLLIFFCFCCGKISAQGNVKVDSLKTISLSDKSDSLRVKALDEISLFYRTKGDLDSANYFAAKGLQISKQGNFKYGEAKSLYYLGIVSYVRGTYVQAMDTLMTAAELFKSLGDKKNYSSVLTVIGGVKTTTGDLVGALEYQLQSLKIKEEIKDSANLAAAFNNIGNIYLATEEYQKALSYFQSALKLNLKFKNIDKVSDNYYSIANVYNELQKDSLALTNINMAIHIADSLGQIESLSYAYGMMAGIKLDDGDFNGAAEYYLKSIVISEKLDDQRMIASHSQHLGVVYQKMGDKKKAEFYMLRGLQIADTINDIEDIIASHLSLSQLYEETGDYQKALSHYKQYKDAEDTLMNDEKGKELTRKEMNYEFDKKLALDKLEQAKKDAVSAEARKTQNIITYSIAILLVLAIVFFFFLYNRFLITRKQKAIIAEQKAQVELQRDQVNHQNEVIQEKNKNITDSINYAQRIQQAMLPGDDLFKSLLPQSFIFFLPKDIVSGDFYWITELNDYIFYATADSTGHGVPGGFMSVLGASLLNEVVNEKKITEPADILDMMKIKIIGALKQRGEAGENKDGMDMVLCRLNKKTNELSFAAANNPVWLVRDGILTEYKPDKQSVGIGSEDDKPFSRYTIQLQKNDIVYTLTDGFADQFGGTRGKKFKYKALQELLLSISNNPMDEQTKILLEKFVEWQGNLEQVDDVLVMGMKV